MIDLFRAFLLALILEGLAYAAFPDHMKRALLAVSAQPASTLRVVALTIAGAALIVLYLFAL